MVAFKRQAAVSNANFKKAYDDKAKPYRLARPLSGRPNSKRAPSARAPTQSSFVPKEGKDVALTMSDEAILTFLHLFGQIVKKARWGLAFDLDDKARRDRHPQQIM